MDISKGECSITEESILKLDNEESQKIELGLLTLFEEIEYNKKGLENSIREKEILIQEIHHRVKNNLQIVSSLLNLEKNSNDDEKIKSILMDFQCRIKTISIVHNKLLNPENIGMVDCRQYLKGLISEIKSANTISPDDIHFSLNIHPFKLNVDTAIPLGLLINEIFTNVMKYGSSKNGLTEAYLDILQEGPHSFLMNIGDNGPGYANEIFNQEEGSVGVTLIRALTEQLDGIVEKIDFREKPGTHYRLAFKLPSI